MTISVHIEGEAKVMAMLQHEAYQSRAEHGLIDAAHAMERDAKANLKEHHFRGQTERNTTTSDIERNGDVSSVTVGIHGGMAPQGRPLEFGWKSESGKMPPIQPIADWIVSKGIGQKRNAKGGVNYGKGGKAARVNEAAFGAAYPGATVSFAFLIARKIQKRGYSFPPLHWLGRAYDSGSSKVSGYIERRMQER